MSSDIHVVGVVTSEGGPLILLDWASAADWLGIDDGGDDYKRACALFDADADAQGGQILTRSGHAAVLWEMGGAGAADILRRGEDEVVIVRTWPRAADAGADACLADAAGEERRPLGILSVPSGMLVALWAAENGHCVGDMPREGRPPGELSVATAGLVVKCRPGIYDVSHDLVASPHRARRCRLRNQANLRG